MKSLFITLLFITSFVIGNAQQTPLEKFDKDIKNNKITLYILGGIASRHYPGEKDFQTKYKLHYHDFGCIAPANLSFYKDYNFLVLTHLKNIFGNEWKKDIRKDILGWEEWQKKN
ncbi:hypothetical protein [Flavobacterium sp. NRK1]|uniref:FEKKY domain-containing protein n=1 Tax=Flavobacterium sp. NRK1 TaxID=2954929 RepID=UPI002092CD44|nr:hypothetical protein [Flavobacterium sp. NRK1]MCO6146759.1 hypothetical protein [Flavobacterium sp. NRK1]